MISFFTKHKAYLALFVIALAVIATYWGLGRTFYQQDEWQEIGLLRSGVITLNPFAEGNGWKMLIGQGRFFSDLMLSVLLLQFPFQLTPFAVVAVVLHLLNVYLVYLLGIRLAKSQVVAITAALFFALNAVSHQTIIWMGAVATLPTTSLILASILCYLNWISSQSIRWFYWSIAALATSLLFKEIGIFLVILLPLYHWLFGRAGEDKQGVRKLGERANLILLGYGLVIVVLRLISLTGAGSVKNGTIIAGGNDFVGKIIVHAILYPLTSIYQTIVPSMQSYALAEKISYLQYPFVTTTSMADIVPQTMLTDLIATIGSLTLVAIVWLLVRRSNQSLQQSLYLGVGIAMLSFLPYIVLDRGGSYMDSRYYYIATIGVGILLGLIADALWRWRLAGVMIVVFSLIMLSGVHITDTRNELDRQQKLAADRLTVLNSIKQSYPSLPDKTVVYIEGDRAYDAPNNHVPFQQGLGYTLMVWYGENQSFHRELLADKYLWDLASEGYRETGDNAFGYFGDIATLRQAVVDYQIPVESVIAFNWNSKKKQLTEVSESIRLMLP